MNYLKPGKDNREERMNFVKYWAEYVRTHSDIEWSRQQKKLINSQLQSAKANKISKEELGTLEKSAPNADKACSIKRSPHTTDS